MKSTCLFPLVLLTGLLLSRAASAPDPDAGKIVVYRDEFGVPHLYADTPEQACYAMGWAQAEDRLEELLRNYLRSTGEMAAAFGASHLMDDLQSRASDHYGMVRLHHQRIRREMRAHVAEFVRGINDYLQAHPAEVPAWWGSRRVDVFMPVAFARWFMWGWPVGQALGDLRKAGVTPQLTADARGSNMWAIAPSRTALQAPILVVDPHLSWFGAQRFWEFRVHAGDWNASGFIPAGCLYVGLGHNDHLAWAMTTGGPDTADVYELRLNPDNPKQYQYDGAMRELAERVLEIPVLGEPAPRRLTVYASHHGPVVARRGNKAWAVKLAYASEVQFAEVFYEFNFAKNLAEFRRGLELNQIMPQNVMAADTEGNIYYQRAGRVPVRPAGYDFSKPVDGSTSKTEWLGIHPASDHIRLLNPAQGYMQNCNIAPDAMMVGSPLTRDRQPAYLFGEAGGRTNMRGARAVQLLDADRSVTLEEAMAHALDTTCFGYQNWLHALADADRAAGQAERDNPDYVTLRQSLAGWDGRADAGSVAALHFWFWRQALLQLSPKGAKAIAGKLDDLMSALGRGREHPQPLSPEEQTLLVQALARAAAALKQQHGRLDVPYGEVFRVGRDDRSWPVGGNNQSEAGMLTLRTIGFGPERDDRTRWGQFGQTSTQVIALTRPIQSWTQPPIGQSDRRDSPHYHDQAEKLFSPAQFKPGWYAKADLLQHVRSRTELSPR